MLDIMLTLMMNVKLVVLTSIVLLVLTELNVKLAHLTIINSELNVYLNAQLELIHTVMNVKLVYPTVPPVLLDPTVPLVKKDNIYIKKDSA